MHTLGHHYNYLVMVRAKSIFFTVGLYFKGEGEVEEGLPLIIDRNKQEAMM